MLTKSARGIGGAWCVLAVVLPWAAWGASYYVDATNGDDGRAGTSEATAWQTLEHFNTFPFQPGDFILLKRGEMWREQLAIVRSGQEGAPITVGAYGAGDAPILNGAAPVAGWSAASGNTYTATVTTGPEVVVFDGIDDGCGKFGRAGRGVADDGRLADVERNFGDDLKVIGVRLAAIRRARGGLSLSKAAGECGRPGRLAMEDGPNVGPGAVDAGVECAFDGRGLAVDAGGIVDSADGDLVARDSAQPRARRRHCEQSSVQSARHVPAAVADEIAFGGAAAGGREFAGLLFHLVFHD